MQANTKINAIAILNFTPTDQLDRRLDSHLFTLVQKKILSALAGLREHDHINTRCVTIYFYDYMGTLWKWFKRTEKKAVTSLALGLSAIECPHYIWDLMLQSNLLGNIAISPVDNPEQAVQSCKAFIGLLCSGEKVTCYTSTSFDELQCRLL